MALAAACGLVAVSGMSEASFAGDTGGASPIIANFFDGAAPGTITVAGITVYGTVDYSAVYNSHGAEPTGTFYQGAPYQISKYSGRSHFLATDNAMSQSFVGIKTNIKLSDIVPSGGLTGWSVISDAQIGFDPAYADIADACKTLALNNGISGLAQTANLDGNRCGQIFNGNLYGGLKNDVLGQLTFGRQTSLLADALSAGDPEQGSYAFSFITYSGTVGGGAGATEDARWNNSIRYSNTIGIFRVAGMYRFEGEDQGGNAYSVSAGVDLPGPLKGLSVDGVWAHFNDAIVSSSLSANDCKAILTSAFLSDCPQLNTLAATVQDDEAWAISLKYNLAHYGLDTVTAFGGYEHMTSTNPSDKLSQLRTIGGYDLYPGDINYAKYDTARQLDVYWLGAKWAITPKVTLAAAWYHEDQNSFITGSGAGTGCTNPGQGVKSASNCAGSLEWVSGSVDYQWTKRLDVYAGLSYTQVDNGLSNGFTYTNSWNPVAGARFRF